MIDLYPQLSRRFEPLVREALDDVWRVMRRKGSLDQLTEAISTGGATGVLQYLNDLEDELAARLAPALENAILQSGRAFIDLFPAGFTSNTFTLVNANTAQYVRDYTFGLIQEISAQTREAVRLAVQSGILAGRNPRSLAYDFRAAVGLTADRELTVERFRQALIDGDAAYIRSLGTASEDMIRLATSGTRAQRRIDDAVNRLRLRYTTQRSETIARTETLRAISIGQDQSVRQLGLTGDLEKRWQARHGDGRTRHAHLEIEEEWIAYDAPFETPLGPLMFPRDPNGTAANTINCRCRMQVRIRPDTVRRLCVPGAVVWMAMAA